MVGYAKGVEPHAQRAKAKPIAATSLTETSPRRLRLPFRLDRL